MTDGSQTVDLATSSRSVSAFCKAVLLSILPNEFWGYGDERRQNRNHFVQSVDQFIGLRRYESLNLHNVIQGMKVRILSQKGSISTLTRFTDISYYLAQAPWR